MSRPDFTSPPYTSELQSVALLYFMQTFPLAVQVAWRILNLHEPNQTSLQVTEHKFLLLLWIKLGNMNFIKPSLKTESGQDQVSRQ